MGTRTFNSTVKKKLMSNLYQRTPARLFTFGCSFTKWAWCTWSDILARDLNVPYYNFGKWGAGNQYIFNVLMQCINNANINSDDLVIICWTTPCREDRRLREGWITPGNIFTNLENFYSKDYIKKYVDFPIGFSIRDFAVMDAARRILDSIGCQYHMMSMADFNLYDQWGRTFSDDSELQLLSKLIQTYDILNKEMLPSFYKVLWNNDISVKFNIDKEKIHTEFIDGHPSPQEHLDYLKTVFPYHTFNDDTIHLIENVEKLWIRMCKQKFGIIEDDLVQIEQLNIADSQVLNII
jgi:hypothetical protein